MQFVNGYFDIFSILFPFSFLQVGYLKHFPSPRLPSCKPSNTARSSSVFHRGLDEFSGLNNYIPVLGYATRKALTDR